MRKDLFPAGHHRIVARRRQRAIPTTVVRRGPAFEPVVAVFRRREYTLQCVRCIKHRSPWGNGIQMEIIVENPAGEQREWHPQFVTCPLRPETFQR